ncbi:MAG: DNA gyrase subunit A [Candidatus Babeliales bacterium]
MATSQSSGSNENRSILPVLIQDELKLAFLLYAMAVVRGRAIVDIRDGLKTVHRRILYTMYQLGFFYNKPHHKSVRVVGEVLGKYHPHGDQAVYIAMVKMVQDFSKRYPLLNGQGNWGSVDGDNAAAMRYTEVRMAKIAQELLADIDKETVPFVPNFDDTTTEPSVLPSRIPHLLINGTTGIAVGMAASVPPHNLTEVVDACIALMKNEALTDEELFTLVPAPDFPTGGIICGRSGIVRAYKTGRGRVIVRGVVDVKESKKGTELIITELPYMVNKAKLAVDIANLVKNKVIEGIVNIKDESDKREMRLRIELRRGEIPSVVLNQLYKHTSLQTSISILMLGLLDNKPLVFSLRDLLRHFIIHRKDVVYKRTSYELKKAKARKHILQGFVIGLNHIDEIVQIIKQAEDAKSAIQTLHKRFLLTEEQAKAILDMRLQKLTGLEQEKMRQELDVLIQVIVKLKAILEQDELLKEEIIKELIEIRDVYGDARRTRIEGPVDILTEVDLIPDEEVVVTLTLKGYCKRVPLEIYGVQHRGGRGKMGIADLEQADDVIQDIFITKTHDELLFFTNLGRVYSLDAFQIPEASRVAKGRAIVNILPLQEGEKVVKLLAGKDLENAYIIMATKKGIIKKTVASAFTKIRATGIRALTLKEGDELVVCKVSSGDDHVVLATSLGRGIRFLETEVRDMGRNAAGVIGIRLSSKDYLIGMEVVREGQELLFATEHGYGKRVQLADFRQAHRGGMGVRTIPTDARNGKVVGVAVVTDRSNLLLIDLLGKIIRLSPTEIRTLGRQAKGVRLIRLEDDQKLLAVVSFEEEDKEEEEGDVAAAGEMVTQA